MINGHFVAAEEKDYEKWRAVFRKGRKEGWIDGIGEVRYEIENEDEE